MQTEGTADSDSAAHQSRAQAAQRELATREEARAAQDLEEGVGDRGLQVEGTVLRGEER